MASALHDNRRTVTRGKLRAPAQRVASDPKLRGDHLCVTAGCGRPLTRIAILNEDPFCSTVCCRAWYGTEIESLLPRGRRQR